MVISPTQFNDGYTLSPSTQPAIKSLIDLLRDPSEHFTFVVGAGVSLDSGLPDWDKLVRRIAEKITPPVHAHMALADRDEPMRKAEYVIQMRLASTGGGIESIVQDSLYEKVSGLSPGSLAQSLCELILALERRASIITTNFDEVLEASLDSLGASPRIQRFTLKQRKQWKGVLSNPSSDIPIMHLHGVLPRVGTAKRPFILTESHFLRYGKDARRVVKQALDASTVVFVGVSMTDPNLIGPLWDTRHSRGNCFVLVVPSPSTRHEAIEQVRAYSLKKNEYLETALAVTTVFLKSYGQLDQFVRELVVATKEPASYDSNDPLTSTRYGHRLMRTLRRCYDKLGSIAPSYDIPNSGRIAAAVELQSALDHGAIGQELSALRHNHNVKTEYSQARAQIHDTTTEPERFGLALWLRAVGTTIDTIYSISLVASTTNVYLLSSPSMPFSNVTIEPESPYLEPRALFRGVPVSRDLPRTDPITGWRAGIAVPIRALEDVLDQSGHTYRKSVTIGAICLTTTGYISAAKPPLSLLSVLDSQQKERLVAKLEFLARDLLDIG